MSTHINLRSLSNYSLKHSFSRLFNLFRIIIHLFISLFIWLLNWFLDNFELDAIFQTFFKQHHLYYHICYPLYKPQYSRQRSINNNHKSLHHIYFVYRWSSNYPQFVWSQKLFVYQDFVQQFQLYYIASKHRFQGLPTVHFLPFESTDLYLPFKSKQSFIIITACAATRPQSLPGAETLATAAGPASLTSLTPDHQLREDFTVLAKDLVASLKTIVSTLVRCLKTVVFLVFIYVLGHHNLVRRTFFSKIH